MAARRRSPSKTVETQVLMASRRRCCLCVFLDEHDEVCRGQIAHLNHDPSDSSFDNLVFLCLDHHDDYDGQRSQSKALSSHEVRQYRTQLYAQNPTFKLRSSSVDEMSIELKPLPDTSQYELLRKKFPQKLSFTSTPWRCLSWQVANQPEFFAFKAGNRADGVCLIERIDIPDGRIVIVCIQTVGNPGQSITNNVEALCFQVCERFDIPPERLVWLEHYDNFKSDDWSLVTFSGCPPKRPFENPQWQSMTPEIWQELRLQPKKRLAIRYGHFESKVKKLFHWPTQNLF